MSWTKGLHPQLVPYFRGLFAAIQRADPAARVSSAYRSSTLQRKLYNRYLAGQSQFPAAPPGRSHHEFGRAIDVLASPRVLEAAGLAWERIGGRWGGRFKDPIHFEA